MQYRQYAFIDTGDLLHLLNGCQWWMSLGFKIQRSQTPGKHIFVRVALAFCNGISPAAACYCVYLLDLLRICRVLIFILRDFRDLPAFLGSDMRGLHIEE